MASLAFPAGRAISPWKASISGDALQLVLLAAPQLDTGLVLWGIGAVSELLAERLLALPVPTIRVARRFGL